MSPPVAGAVGGGPRDAMTPRAAVVRRTVRENHDTTTLFLEVDGALPFAPGQFDMLYVPGVGEAAISHSGDAAAGQVAHTVRGVGPVSRALAGLRRGAALGLRGPFGTAWPLDAADGRDLLLAAGGIGLAPLRPALYAALRERHRFGRVALLYGARSPADLLYAKELARWRSRFDVEVLVTVDRCDGGWAGDVGVVTGLLGRTPLDPATAVAFVCGPEVMLRFAARALARLGFGRERVHVSLERNMRCGVGLCGHCQLGPRFVCKDGPVFRLDEAAPLLAVREL